MKKTVNESGLQFRPIYLCRFLMHAPNFVLNKREFVLMKTFIKNVSVETKNISRNVKKHVNKNK